ncbi:non-homologous end-joining DNA ligase [Actinomadura kijaniata]|uniref:non-homologous end-joining DNA ligase n=1 Tax=Actinomadura kijaniata TaxID=46161 RepID=UPI003F1C6F7F
MSSKRVAVKVEGRELSLSSLDKDLYPEFTKGEVVDYYTRIAPVMLPHLRDRPATRIRFPDGIDGTSFVEKNAPSGTPDWVRTVTLATPGSSRGRDTLDFVVVDDLPTLVWCAQMAALELHVPQWTVGPRGGRRKPDLMVFDLDPGAPASIMEACEVALLLRDLLAADGLTAHPKTSGKKGLHLYVPIAETDRAEEYARQAAYRLATDHKDLVVARMERQVRRDRVFVDWSQNNPAKTTVAPYSLRAAERPSVSTPITWEELEDARRPSDLVFTAPDVLDRVAEHGDLLEPLLKERRPLP